MFSPTCRILWYLGWIPSPIWCGGPLCTWALKPTTVDTGQQSQYDKEIKFSHPGFRQQILPKRLSLISMMFIMRNSMLTLGQSVFWTVCLEQKLDDIIYCIVDGTVHDRQLSSVSLKYEWSDKLADELASNKRSRCFPAWSRWVSRQSRIYQFQHVRSCSACLNQS